MGVGDRGIAVPDRPRDLREHLGEACAFGNVRWRFRRGRRANSRTRSPAHLGARLFHWIMALSMLALLFTAFLPKVGVEFPWVTYHWIAGIVLTISIIYHIFHAFLAGLLVHLA